MKTADKPKVQLQAKFRRIDRILALIGSNLRGAAECLEIYSAINESSTFHDRVNEVHCGYLYENIVMSLLHKTCLSISSMYEATEKHHPFGVCKFDAKASFRNLHRILEDQQVREKLRQRTKKWPGGNPSRGLEYWSQSESDFKRMFDRTILSVKFQRLEQLRNIHLAHAVFQSQSRMGLLISDLREMVDDTYELYGHAMLTFKHASTDMDQVRGWAARDAKRLIAGLLQSDKSKNV